MDFKTPKKMFFIYTQRNSYCSSMKKTENLLKLMMLQYV